MGYYIRFITTDDKKVSLPELESWLKRIDLNYRIENDETYGELMHGDDLYGLIEINLPNDGLFDEEIEELVESAEDAKGEKKAEVLKTLNNAKAIFCIQVLDQGRSSDEETLCRINPVWDWCFQNFNGLVKADAEGYYDTSGLVLEVK